MFRSEVNTMQSGYRSGFKLRLWPLLSISVLMLYLIMALLSSFQLFTEQWQLATDDSLSPLDSEHWLGTNQAGQDIFQRTLRAASHAVWTGLLVSIGATTLGFVLGGLAGYRAHTWSDHGLQMLMDLFDSIPFYLLVILLAAAFGRWSFAGPLAMILAIWTSPARLVREEVHRLRESSYIRSAVGFGIRPIRVLLVHLLPNLRQLFLVQSLIVMVVTIKTDVVLGFLGIGDPTQVTFGSMIAESASDLFSGHWGNLIGGTCGLLVLVLSLNHLILLQQRQMD